MVFPVICLGGYNLGYGVVSTIGQSIVHPFILTRITDIQNRHLPSSSHSKIEMAQRIFYQMVKPRYILPIAASVILSSSTQFTLLKSAIDITLLTGAILTSLWTLIKGDYQVLRSKKVSLDYSALLVGGVSATILIGFSILKIPKVSTKAFLAPLSTVLFIPLSRGVLELSSFLFDFSHELTQIIHAIALSLFSLLHQSPFGFEVILTWALSELVYRYGTLFFSSLHKNKMAEKNSDPISR